MSGMPFLFVLLAIMGRSVACPNGWFGSRCQFQCHCTNNECDKNGTCSVNSKCIDEWFGPSCQLQNLALVYTRTEATPSSAFDGNEETCESDSINQQTITVAWNMSYVFLFLRIKFNKKVVDTEPDTMFQITNDTKYKVSYISDTLLDIIFDKEIATQRLAIGGRLVQSICELYISGGRNVALKKNATQSSTYELFSNPFQRSQAVNAVDGNRTSDWNLGRCTNTNEPSAYYFSTHSWSVDLADVHGVNRYVMYNRIDAKGLCCPGRLTNFTIESFNSSRDAVFQFKYNYNNNGWKAIYSAVSNTIAVTKVTVTNYNIALSICEMEIYGELICPQGRYGLECEHSCNCADNGSCLASTGACRAGCKTGFFGEGCLKECENGRWGLDCKSNCSENCFTPYKCDAGNGTCIAGCSPGSIPPLCTQACLNGTFGYNCTESCSIYCVNNECHERNGTCKFGCVEKYKGEICMEAQHEDDASDGQDIPLAVIIAPAIAGIVLLSLLVACTVILRKRRHRSSLNNGVDVKAQQPMPATMANVTNDTVVTEAAQTKASVNVDTINTFIRILDLNRFLQIHTKAFFSKQFKSVPIPQNVTTEVGLNNLNKNKNRYKDIVPYDQSRVHLEINTDDNEGDYINASYVQGYKIREKFIASQGPNTAMVNDFIRMLWEQQVDKVVMLTNLIEHAKTKCERYWPEEGEQEFGGIKVKLTTTQVCADYTIRRLELRKNNTLVHHVTQFHFTSWPDTGVPKTPWSLVDFHQRVAAEPTNKPIVVHCSAGVGRTGSFIALCNVMSQAKDTGGMDFFQTLAKLRSDRMLMIQTEEQYEFLHRAAQVALLCLETTITATNIIERVKVLETKNVTGRSNMEKEFEAVCSVSASIHERITSEEVRSDKAGIYLNTSAVGQRSHNRFPDIIPPKAFRTRLAKENKDMGEYINAILLPSFKKQNHQIVTQLPLPATVVDFWRLTTQYNILTIVAFEVDSFAEDEAVAQYLPNSVEEPLSCAPFEIHTGPVLSEGFWEEQKITVQLNKKTKTKSSDDHVLNHIKYNGDDISSENLLNFIKKIQVCDYQTEGVVLYMCRNGAKYSGLACVLRFLLDRMDNDLHLTIPIVVGAIKSIRPQVIPNVEQYNLLYHVLQLYHESSNTYSNFGLSKE